MKKSLLFASLVLIFLVLTAESCDGTPTSDSVQNNLQEQSLSKAVSAIGLPNIHNFFEKKTLKKILEMRDNPDLTTFTYTQAMDGHFVYIGRSIGYGIPYSTQFTNPMRVNGSSSSYVSLPQADPNGLFSPSSSAATWILLVDEKTNEPYIMYFEPNMVVYEKKLPKRLVSEFSLPSEY